MVAYSMSKVRWNGQKYLFPIIVATMMIPYQVTLIPLYMIWNKLGLIGSIAPDVYKRQTDTSARPTGRPYSS